MFNESFSLNIGITEPVGIISFVAKQRLGRWKGVDHQRRAAEIAHLTFGQQQDQRSPLAITYGVQLGVQTTFGAPDTSGSAAK